MSFGDPNNPYGQPPGPYGQPPQGQQPGYGYPQGPPVQAYGGFGPMVMPGGVKGARIMLFVLGGFQALAAVVMVVASAWVTELISQAESKGTISGSTNAETAAVSTGILIAFGLIIAGFATWGIITGVKYAKGGNGIRISAIVYASIVVLFSLLATLGLSPVAPIGLVLGILVIVLSSKQDAVQWFNRPKY